MVQVAGFCVTALATQSLAPSLFSVVQMLDPNGPSCPFGCKGHVYSQEKFELHKEAFEEAMTRDGASSEDSRTLSVTSASSFTVRHPQDSNVWLRLHTFVRQGWERLLTFKTNGVLIL